MTIRVINGTTGEIVLEFNNYNDFNNYINNYGLDIDYYTEEIE